MEKAFIEGQGFCIDGLFCNVHEGLSAGIFCVYLSAEYTWTLKLLLKCVYQVYTSVSTPARFYIKKRQIQY